MIILCQASWNGCIDIIMSSGELGWVMIILL
jgi:hypothetical protein